MLWTTDVFLKLLGVGELLENAQAVVEDWLGRKRPPPAGLRGKVAIVTGGNAGVGYNTAAALLRHGASVVLAVRSRERGDAAAARLASAAAAAAAQGGAAAAEVSVDLLDLASLDSVRAFVRRWAAAGRPLDLLVCNAGIMCPPERIETGDGFELQWQARGASMRQGTLHPALLVCDGCAAAERCLSSP